MAMEGLRIPKEEQEDSTAVSEPWFTGLEKDNR